MKMPEEDIKKLKQLDRIEYRVRMNELLEDREKNTNAGPFFNWVSIFFFLAFIIIALLHYIITKELTIIQEAKTIFITLLVVILLSYILDILFTIKYNKLEKKLNEEYFKVEAK